MDRTAFRLAIFFSALAWPVIASALPPPNVTRLEAQFVDGRVTVSWEAPAEDIAAYRIYYGQKSILRNGGTYDDFAAVDGVVITFTFPTVPPYPEIFIAIAAVNGEREESSAFVEEVQLSLASEQPRARSAQGNVPSPSGKKSAVPLPEMPEATPLQKQFSGPLVPSGLPVLGIALGSGAMAGWRWVRRRSDGR